MLDGPHKHGRCRSNRAIKFKILSKCDMTTTSTTMTDNIFNSLFQGDVTSSDNESAIFRWWKSNLKWRMFHRLNDKGDNLLTEIPGCPEKRMTGKVSYNNPSSRKCYYQYGDIWNINQSELLNKFPQYRFNETARVVVLWYSHSLYISWCVVKY